MNMAFPKRTVYYNSPVIDASRWDKFEPRDGDVFICTPPKCGTTWTQAICALLIFGHADSDVKPGVISPWLDARHFPWEEMTAMLEAQTHKRFIKTHTPLDGIPYFPNCTYLVIYRDPRDVHFSARNHATNQQNGKNTHRATKDIGEGFRLWTRKPYLEGDEDNFSLVSIVHHYETFKKFANLPNLHMFHYADLKRDLRGNMERFSKILGTTPPATPIGEMAKAASFENMKKNAAQFVPGAGQGRWKDEGRFFHKGTGNQWQGVLSAEDLAFFDARMRELLSQAEAAWLQDGGAGEESEVADRDGQAT